MLQGQLRVGQFGGGGGSQAPTSSISITKLMSYI